jgi:hypothetical protein
MPEHDAGQARAGRIVCSMTTRRRWTRSDMQALRQQYGQVPATRIAASLGRTVDAIHRRAWEWGLEMPAENRGALMRFQKYASVIK